MLRKTVAIAGLTVLVAASLLAVDSQRPGVQATTFSSGSAMAGRPTMQPDTFVSLVPGQDAYLPFVIQGKPPSPPPTRDPACSPCYPGLCIPPPPPDLDCGEIPFCRFRVVGCDPHGFNGDGDGIGCERCFSEMHWVRQPALAD